MSCSIEKDLVTILVVDDDEMVRKTVVAILEFAKFRVLSANSGLNALKVALENPAKIDLLLSDVEMPQMSGPDLGKRMTETRPDLPVLLMSGGLIANGIVLNNGWAFIQKPFVPVILVRMINKVLHSQPHTQYPGIPQPHVS